MFSFNNSTIILLILMFLIISIFIYSFLEYKKILIEINTMQNEIDLLLKEINNQKKELTINRNSINNIITNSIQKYNGVKETPHINIGMHPSNVYNLPDGLERKGYQNGSPSESHSEVSNPLKNESNNGLDDGSEGGTESVPEGETESGTEGGTESVPEGGTESVSNNELTNDSVNELTNDSVNELTNGIEVDLNIKESLITGNYKYYNNKDLRNMCLILKLPISGTKATLINRISNYQNKK